MIVDKNAKTFIIHIKALEVTEIIIYLTQKAEISSLFSDNISNKVLSKYSNYISISLINYIIEILK